MFPPRLTRSLLRFFFLALPPLLVAGMVRAGEPTTPANLYKKYCSACHGKGGDGKSSAAQGMIPPPRDFTAPEIMVELTREGMLDAVTEGRPETAMVAWKRRLKPEEIAGVIDYIRNALMPASRAKGASPGRRLFAKKCSVCHGDRGEVARWAQSGLTPPPRNFTTDNARWKLTRERMIFSISYGRPETAMPPWLGRISSKDIETVISYIREAFMFPGGLEKSVEDGPSGSHGPGEHAHDHYNAADMLRPMPNSLTGDVAWGKTFYEKQCTPCHGEKGDGKGTRSDLIYPKPRDFLHPSSQHKFNRPHLFEAISKGKHGSEMPAWNKVLTDQEIANLAEFVFQTFIRPVSKNAHNTPQTNGHPNH